MASSKAKRPFRVVSKLETMAAKAPMKMAGLQCESSVLKLPNEGNRPPNRKRCGERRKEGSSRNAPVADETCRRSDGDETADSARAVPHRAPLAFESPIHEHPEETAETRGEVGVGDGDGSFDVGGES